MGTEYYLTDSELVYTCQKAGIKSLVSFDLRQWEINGNDEVLAAGHASLQQRGLLTADQMPVDELVTMANIIHHSDFVIQITYDQGDSGSGSYVYHLSKDGVVEQALLEDGFAWLRLDDAESILTRVTELIPLTLVDETDRVYALVQPAEIDRISELLGSGDQTAAQASLAQIGVPPEWFSPILQAMSNSLLSMWFVIASMQNGSVTGGGAVYIFADESSSWGIWPVENDERLALIPTGINDLLNAVSSSLERSGRVIPV